MVEEHLVDYTTFPPKPAPCALLRPLLRGPGCSLTAGTFLGPCPLLPLLLCIRKAQTSHKPRTGPLLGANTGVWGGDTAPGLRERFVTCLSTGESGSSSPADSSKTSQAENMWQHKAWWKRPTVDNPEFSCSSLRLAISRGKKTIFNAPPA